RMLAPLSLLSFISSDLTSFHLHNHLNHSVPPCTDFYSHVCASGMHLNETIRFKSEYFYQDLAEKLQTRTRNNSIMNDIISARESDKCTFDSQLFKSNLLKRCGAESSCFLEEFYYFFNLYNVTTEKV
ncbi:hypothetical protein PMAYCL1PPCAC_17372, partial [Pristionchus mayeri]